MKVFIFDIQRFDAINNTVDGASVVGTTGDDVITSTGNEVTINALTGNDSINVNNERSGAYIQYAAGDGNDTITGYTSEDGAFNYRLKITGSAYSSVISGSNVVLGVGTGSITIEDALLTPNEVKDIAVDGSYRNSNGVITNLQNGVIVYGTNNADSIVNEGEYSTIEAFGGNDTIAIQKGSVSVNIVVNAGEGNDSILANSQNITVNGGTGSDSITVQKYGYVTVDAGEDNDVIFLEDAYVATGNAAYNSSILGGGGNDSVYGAGNYVTVNGGAGSDTIGISGQSNVYIYKSGDGNDVVNEFTADDTLVIGDGTGTYSTTTSANGSDVIVTVGDGQITLGDAAGLTLNIQGSLISDGDTDTATGETVMGGTKNGTSGDDTLSTTEYDITTAKTTIYTALYGFEGNDELNNTAAIEKVTLDGGSGNDRFDNRGANSSLVGGSGDDYISNRNGNDSKVDNAIIDGGAGADVVDNWGDNPLITLGDGNDSVYSKGEKATIDGGEGDDTISSYGSDSSIEGGNGADNITGGGSNLTIHSGNSNDTVTFGGGSDAIYSGVLAEDTAGSNTYHAKYVKDSSIISGAGNDSVYTYETENLSITLGAGANSLTSEYDKNVAIIAGEGKDIFKIYNGSQMNIDLDEGNNELEITNINDSLASDYTITSGTGNDTINVDANNVLINAGDGANSIISGGYEAGNNVTINTGSGNDFISNYYSTEYAKVARQENVLINAGAGRDTIDNSGNKVTINGGAGNDVISNYSGTDVVINGDEGADIITGSNAQIDGGADNDSINANNATVTGGAGNDTIRSGGNVFITYQSGDGNDLIEEFGTNSTLSIGGGYYTSVKSSQDVVLTVGSNKITLQGAANLDSLNITGNYDEEARAFVTNLQQKTSLGYPVIAALLFHPNEYHGFETLPSDYYADSETLTINSSDGLELKGYHYTPENSNDKWVILVHGYGHNHKHMNGFAEMYLTNGYNVLMVDQRAAGESEGEWLTMGAAEGNDVALWTKKIAELNPNAKITLHGVSMGAATAMLAAANSNLTNVTSLVEDCGYTTVMNLIDLAKGMATQLANSEFVEVVNDAAESLTGYPLTAAAPIDSIGKATVPSIFITGDSDTVVPMSNLEELYSASGAKVKEIFTVAGATHGLSALTDSIGYANTVFRFNAEAAGEGWTTSNTVDAISFKGTKYDDNISNSGSDVTISAVAGNDTITNTDNNASYIDGGEGNDFISNSLKYEIVTVDGTEKLNNYYSDTTIVAGAGNDTVINVGGFNASIIGGDGADAIYTKHSYYNTIDAGAGNDYVRIAEGHYQNVFLGDGNDTIQGVQEMDTVISGNWDVGGYANLDGGDGDDVISFGYSNNSTINGGAGNDMLVGFGANAVINGGDGDDEIVLVATKESSRDSTGATVSGGKGNDTITLADADIVYSYEGGNEEIWGVTEGDTIAISTSDTYRTAVSGDDLIISFRNSTDTITLKYAATITPYIDGVTINSDKAGNEVENPVAMIASGNDTYYYESVARATNDADEGSTVTVIADSTETALLNATKGLTIQFAESDTGVYNVTGGNFVSASDVEGFTVDSVISSGGNTLSIANGSTATFNDYAITGGSNGYTFALQNDVVAINGVDIGGNSTASFDTKGNISLTSGAVASAAESDTATFNLGAGTYTLNNNTVSATAANAITVDSDTASFTVSSDAFTYNGFEFSGKGAVSVANDLPTMTAGVSVNRDERAMVVLTESGQNTIDGRGFWMTEDLSDGITVGAIENGIGAAHIIPYESFPDDAGKLFAEEALIYGDDSYTVRLNEDGIKNIYGLSAGSTVKGTAYFEGEVDTLGSILQLVVDGSGSYTFGNKTYNLNGAVDSVNVVAFSSRFYTEGTSALRKVYYLNGTLSGDFSSAVTINQAAMNVQVLGDTNIDVYATDSAKPIDDAGKDSISSSGNVSVISGVGNGASIISAGGAVKVTTNEEGTFTFRELSDTIQPFTVSGDDSVDFILTNYTKADGSATMQVEGVNNFENGYYTINSDTAYHAINVGENISASDEYGMLFNGLVTFVIADSKVVSIDGIDIAINNVKGDVTVHAENDIAVNQVIIDVKGDTDYNIIVSDSKTAALVNISAGASVNVASVDIQTDNNGEFKVGEYAYTVNDTADGIVTFTTDNNAAVKNVNGFIGTLNTSANNVTVNGSAFATTNTDVTITSAESAITKVEGLVSGDSIGGALDSATILIPANEDSDTVEVTVNSLGYTVNGDSTGLEVKGNIVNGLDYGAKLQISAAGTYNVNSTTLTTKIGDTIIGTAEGSAYVYDPNNVPLDVTTMSDDSISAQVGISNSYTSVQTDTFVAGLAVANGAASNMNGTLALALDNTGSNVVQVADFSNSTGRKRVTLEGGDQNIKFNDEGRNIATISEDATGEKNIALGAGGDLAIVKNTSATVNITTGSGKDTVVTAGDDVSINMGTGAAKIVPNSGNTVLNNYNAATGAGIQLNDIADVARSILNGSISFDFGSITLSDIHIRFDSEDATSSIVNLFNNVGKKQKVAYTSGDGGAVDLSAEKENVLLVGNIGGNTSLMAGSGNDTAIGGAGDYIDLGAGNNYISLSDNSNSLYGAVIGLTSTEGKTEVDGFNTGFNVNSDKVALDISIGKVKFDGVKLTFTNGGGSLSLNGVGSSSDLAQSADLMVDDNFIGSTTLDDISTITYEQGEYQNLYNATFSSAQDTILAICE